MSSRNKNGDEPVKPYDVAVDDAGVNEFADQGSCDFNAYKDQVIHQQKNNSNHSQHHDNNNKRNNNNNHREGETHNQQNKSHYQAFKATIDHATISSAKKQNQNPNKAFSIACAIPDAIQNNSDDDDNKNNRQSKNRSSENRKSSNNQDNKNNNNNNFNNNHHRQASPLSPQSSTSGPQNNNSVSRQNTNANNNNNKNHNQNDKSDSTRRQSQMQQNQLQQQMQQTQQQRKSEMNVHRNLHLDNVNALVGNPTAGLGLNGDNEADRREGSVPADGFKSIRRDKEEEEDDRGAEVDSLMRILNSGKDKNAQLQQQQQQQKPASSFSAVKAPSMTIASNHANGIVGGTAESNNLRNGLRNNRDTNSTSTQNNSSSSNNAHGVRLVESRTRVNGLTSQIDEGRQGRNNTKNPADFGQIWQQEQGGNRNDNHDDGGYKHQQQYQNYDARNNNSNSNNSRYDTQTFSNGDRNHSTADYTVTTQRAAYHDNQQQRGNNNNNNSNNNFSYLHENNNFSFNNFNNNKYNQPNNYYQQQQQPEPEPTLPADNAMPRAGFANMGNTCFANSIYNLLLLAPEFSETLFEDPGPKLLTPAEIMDSNLPEEELDRKLRAHGDDIKKRKVVEALRSLHEELFRQRKRIENDYAFRQGIRAGVMKEIFKDHFYDYSQHDAQEFLGELFDACSFVKKPPLVKNDKKIAQTEDGPASRNSTATNKTKDPRRRDRKEFEETIDVDNSDDDDDGEKTIEEAIGMAAARKSADRRQKVEPKPKPTIPDYIRLSEYPTDKVPHHKGGIQGGPRNLFRGQIIITTTCKKCGHEVEQFDDWDILQMPINVQSKDEKVTMQTLIDRLQRPPEELEDYKCDRCGDKTATKPQTLRFRYLPDVLVVQLKRYSFEKKEVPVTPPRPPATPPFAKIPISNFNLNNNNNNKYVQPQIAFKAPANKSNNNNSDARVHQNEVIDLENDSSQNNNNANDDELYAQHINQHSTGGRTSTTNEDAAFDNKKDLIDSEQIIVDDTMLTEDGEAAENNNNKNNFESCSSSQASTVIDVQEIPPVQKERELIDDEEEVKIVDSSRNSSQQHQQQAASPSTTSLSKQPEKPKTRFEYRATKKDNEVLPCTLPLGVMYMLEEFEEPNEAEIRYYSDPRANVPQPVKGRAKKLYVCCYQLRAVVVHQGMTASSGHYFGGYSEPFNFRAEPSGNTFTQWCKLDDSNVSSLAYNDEEKAKWQTVLSEQKTNVNVRQINVACLLQPEVKKSSYILRYHLLRKVEVAAEDVIKWASMAKDKFAATDAAASKFFGVRN